MTAPVTPPASVEPVAWSVAGPDGQLLRDGEHPFVAWLRIEADTRATEANVWRHRESGPFRVVPLYAADVPALMARIERAERERDGARAAMKCDDDRLRAAAEKVGRLPMGCDTADDLADAILELRARIERAEALLAEALPWIPDGAVLPEAPEVLALRSRIDAALRAGGG